MGLKTVLFGLVYYAAHNQMASTVMNMTISLTDPFRAERAKTVGYPERFAQEALGHNSKAVHRAYAKRALMKLPSLEDYERRVAANVKSAAST